tara:strand:- start:1872 stop:4139 length:2268 start_codon:yes stop_codon:yes gene_type:complete
MKTLIYRNNLKILFKSFVFLIYFFSSISMADIVKEIQISGNDRISDQTVKIFSGINLNDDVTSDDLNKLIKNLYETSFFKNISIKFENNILFIDLEENPLIQTVKIEGIKKTSLIESIRDIIFLKEKSSFVENKIKDDQNKILNALRINGYYFSEINSKVVTNQNNTVDIIYNINLGEKALIKKIKFIGNKIFKDNKLRKVIVSEEARFWKFISSKKHVDIKRFKLDENLLENFYKNNGYYNVKINSSFAQIVEDRKFEIIYNIDAGQKYYFNNLELNIPVDYNIKDFETLNKILLDLKSKSYSLNKIEDILDEVDEIALNRNYEFVSATYNETITDNNKIDLTINLKDTKKFYIEKINIIGNSITSERVIRNKLLSDEGDPFNELLVNKSFNNIRSTRLFKTVETKIQTIDENMTKIIDIKVEEKPTGEIFAGAGTGTSGSSLSFGISENNYLGEGIKLGSEFSFTDDSLTGKLFLNEPNFKNSNRSFNRGFERSEVDNLATFGYETTKTAFVFGTSYEQYRDIFFSPTIESSYETINTTSLASSAKKKQDGDYLDIVLDYSLSLNKLNQNFNPSDGYKFVFSQELPLYTEDFTLINKLNYSKYFETEGDAIYSFSFFTATSNSLTNDDARITKRIFIPSRKLRGFEPGKIGPKDGTEYIGGNFGSSINFATTLPGLLTEIQELDLSLFFDAANVWGVDYSSAIDDNSKVRSSTGIALDWFTPIGPLSLSYSIPLTKHSNDKTENVRFNIGTTF